MSDLQKHLAQQALDGISLVCSDLEMLRRAIAEENPSGTMNVIKSLGRAVHVVVSLDQAKELDQRIRNIYGLIEGE